MFLRLEIIDGPIHKGKTFNFNKGETAIIGPNGCGKSLLAEYLAFALFGTTALRGKVADYKNLSIRAYVTIKGKNYEIDRSTKDCQIILSDTRQIIATGTKICNLKIITLLGYDYNVYKMGNYAEQLDILGLGKMKPSERKSAIDKTLGIGIVDKLIKYANDESLKYKHEAEGLRLALVLPGEKPVKPVDYGDPEFLVREYEKQQKILKEYQDFAFKKEPLPPTEPVFPKGLEGWDSFTMTQLLADKVKLESELLQYKERQKPLYTVESLKELLEQNKKREEYLAYYAKVKFFELDKNPVMTLDEVEHKIAVKKAYESYLEQKKAYDLGKVKCPDCGKEFNPYKDLPTPPTETGEDYTFKELEAEKERIKKKEALDAIPVVEEVPEPLLDTTEIIRQMKITTDWEVAQDKIPELEKELEGYKNVNSANIELLRNYDTDKVLYEERYANYQKEFTAYQQLKIKFTNWDTEQELCKLSNLGRRYREGLAYDRAYEEYAKSVAAYGSLNAKIVVLEHNSQSYKQAVDNLKEMKLKIKGYVLPSLQKVASLLLADMSNGLYTNMTIDPEFNILVEGREVCLFSGSEQAMINLALRLGLGQVLTHKSFSVFIGDEIDASMRDERAQLTADCLRKVSKYIKQVILISHRDIEADHYIDLEGTE